MTASYQFTPLERKSYRLLHGLLQNLGDEGWEVFEAELGHAQADMLLNRWVDNQVARLTWTDGAFSVHTFKKYL
jgi:hypothetical protein